MFKCIEANYVPTITFLRKPVFNLDNKNADHFVKCNENNDTYLGWEREVIIVPI